MLSPLNPTDGFPVTCAATVGHSQQFADVRGFLWDSFPQRVRGGFG